MLSTGLYILVTLSSLLDDYGFLAASSWGCEIISILDLSPASWESPSAQPALRLRGTSHEPISEVAVFQGEDALQP